MHTDTCVSDCADINATGHDMLTIIRTNTGTCICVHKYANDCVCAECAQIFSIIHVHSYVHAAIAA